VRLKDKVAVVTGGGSGIGAAMARRFTREGARAVVVADLNGVAANDVATEIGGHAVQANVALEADVLRVIDTTQARFGPIDLYCSNAGVTAVGGPEVPDEAWQRVWSVNVMAHVYAARALVPRMLERGQGYLLQTASAAGLLSQFDAPYAVTKHAAVAFSEWLAITYSGRGLKVSCLCPGGVDTPMLRAETPERQRLLNEGMISADKVADAVIEGLDAERFLILPHPSIAELVRRKADDPERRTLGSRLT